MRCKVAPVMSLVVGLLLLYLSRMSPRGVVRRVDPRLPKLAEEHMYDAMLALARDVNLNSRDRWGKSALYYMAKDGKEEYVNQLLEAGADPNSASFLLSTPLMIATANGNVAAVKSLIAHGADPRLQNMAGKTAADYIESDQLTDRVGPRWTEIRALLATEQTPDTAEVSAEQGLRPPNHHHHRENVGVNPPGGEEIRVMTYNILNGGNPNSTNHKPSDVFSWPHRRNRVLGMVRFSRPTIAGFQEVKVDQKHDFETAFGDAYHFFGVGREDGVSEGEHMLLMVHKSVKVMATGTFWLSETGEIGSVGWDAVDSRAVTWSVLQLRKGGLVCVLNTHLDHGGTLARQKSAELIVQWVDSHGCGPDASRTLPCNAVLLTADLNAEKSDPAYETFGQSGLKAIQAGEGKHGHHGPITTFSGFYHEHAKVIDFIFNCGGEVLHTATLVDEVGCFRSTKETNPGANTDAGTSDAWNEVAIEPPAPSDHRPVVADILIPSGPASHQT